MLLCRSIAEVHRHRDKPFQSIGAPIQHTDATASARWHYVSGRQHLNRNSWRWHIYPAIGGQPTGVSHRVGGRFGSAGRRITNSHNAET